MGFVGFTGKTHLLGHERQPRLRNFESPGDSDYHCFSQINEFVKRARAAKIHAYIISHLKKEMPTMMGKAKTQQRLIDNLEDEFAKVPHLSPANNLVNQHIQFTIHTLIVLILG